MTSGGDIGPHNGRAPVHPIAPDVDAIRFGFPLAPAAPPIHVPRVQRAPSDALVDAVAALLGDEPCYVAFSGGYDSSLVLAAATRACRRIGHPDPVPLTFRYSAPEAEETVVQEQVVRELGLEDWEIFALDDDEADLLGPSATRALRETGVMYPATVFTRAAVLPRVAPGLLLTGDWGDEIFGPRRLSALAQLVRNVVRRQRVPSRALVRTALTSIAPLAYRTRNYARSLRASGVGAWLEPEERSRLLARAAALEADEPLRSADWPGYYFALPRVWIGAANLRSFYASYGLTARAPLADTTFLGAMHDRLRWYQYRGRAGLLVSLFGDLIPEPVLERGPKASFDRAYLGERCRAFAAQWDGSGVPSGVDVARLGELWRGGEFPYGTLLLLHTAWLASSTA